jgi:hypothetical protein
VRVKLPCLLRFGQMLVCGDAVEKTLKPLEHGTGRRLVDDGAAHKAIAACAARVLAAFDIPKSRRNGVQSNPADMLLKLIRNHLIATYVAAPVAGCSQFLPFQMTVDPTVESKYRKPTRGAGVPVVGLGTGRCAVVPAPSAALCNQPFDNST